nr:hypothetical protein BaRGS_023126 [Batillaria attramentaria]
MSVDVPEPPVDNQPPAEGTKKAKCKALQECHVRDDQAQQRILFCLQKLAVKQDEVMIVMSQLQFAHFLNNKVYAAAVGKYPRPHDLRADDKHQGDFDMVIIHRKYGLLAIEIKVVGDNFERHSKTPDDAKKKVERRLNRAIKQLKKATTLSARDTPWDVTDEVIGRLAEWWEQRVAKGGPDKAMDDDVYTDLARRFCGPATNVKVFCPRNRDVHLRSEGEGVWETAFRFANNVLLKSHLKLLQRAPLLAYVTGPPGTGKTLMLFIMALEWAGDPAVGTVVILSTCSSSVAVSYLILDLLKERLEEPQRAKVQFHHFDLEHGQLDRASETLLDIAKDGQLCVVADEAVGCVEFDNLCDTLCEKLYDNIDEKEKKLRLWAASTYRRDKPARLLEEPLTEPLRTPPVITREIGKAGVMKDWQDIHPYTDPKAPPPTDGPPVRHVFHAGPQHAGNIVDCLQCGKEVAEVLKDLQVGQSDAPAETRTSDDHPEHLLYRDVFVLTREDELHDDAEDSHGHVIQTASSIIRGLRKAGFPVRLVASDDTAAIREVAVHAGADEVIATSVNTVTGLERKVVVWIQGDKTWDDNSGRMLIASRSSAQLVCVSRPPDEEDEAHGNG